mgnify:CR=1 FL=1
MTKEEAELLPSGLVSCLLNNKEVRILKISPDKLTLRLAEKISNILEIKVAFHIFDEYRYKEIIINQYIITNVIEEEFYFIYVLSIKDMEYSKNVKNIFKNYSKYIMLQIVKIMNSHKKWLDIQQNRIMNFLKIIISKRKNGYVI